MAEQRALLLKKFAVINLNFDWLGVFRLRIEVADSRGDMDTRVFVWKRNPINQYTGVTSDMYSHVASPVDLADYPPEEPDPDTGFPYFRRSWVELDLRSTAIADEVWKTTVELVNRLTLAMERLNNLKLIDQIWCGPPGTGGGESLTSIEI